MVSVVFAAAATVLIGGVTAAVDYAALTSARSKLQDVADAASLYAVREISIRGTSDSGVTKAVNQFVDGVSADMLPDGVEPATIVSIDDRDPALVTVRLTAATDLPFGFFVRVGEVAATSRATETDRDPVSLLLLSPNEPHVWKVGGTSSVVSENGVAHVNSTSGDALYGNGNAQVQTRATLVAGPSQAAGQWTPLPSFGAQALPDPWSGKVTWPTPSNCDHTGKVVKNKTETLQPGVYCGGLALKTHAVANLAPGVYILDGDLGVSSGSTLSAPKDVTIVLIGDTSKLDFQAGASVTIGAPKTGPWANLAIACQPQPTGMTSTLIGGAELVLDGVVYMPSQTLLVTGGGAAQSVTGDRIFVVNKLHTQGNGEIFLRGDKEILSEPTGARLVL